MGALSIWHWLIVLAVVLLLFGSKKLPDAARGLGRSMRIFKSEIKEMQSDEKGGDDATTEEPQALTQAQPNAAQFAQPQAHPEQVAQPQQQGYPQAPQQPYQPPQQAQPSAQPQQNPGPAGPQRGDQGTTSQ